jgi:hypothetical protein
MFHRRITIRQRAMIFAGLFVPLAAIAILLGLYPGAPASFPGAVLQIQATPTAGVFDRQRIGALLDASMTPTPIDAPGSQPAVASLADFWSGAAEWVLDVPDTGLPIGESDTIDMGNGVFWSYLHAGTQSAGVVDSCGAPVAFPGCVTRWISTDGGAHFALAEPKCLLACNSCPCGDDDMTWQQQYPRVARAPDGTFYMVFENGGATWLSASGDGVTWTQPGLIAGTGVWNLSVRTCSQAERVGPHPSFPPDYDCMVGGPPGLIIANGQLFVFVGLGQNPGHMGCLRASLGDIYSFHRCAANPLFSGAPEYGPLDVSGTAANPYFDFRFVTSADVLRADGFYYMTYEGIRGPSSPAAGRDDQYGLGLARSQWLDGRWEKYPGNPILGGMADNWGIGHADLIVIGGATYMYTGTPQMVRGRYVLRFKAE